MQQASQPHDTAAAAAVTYEEKAKTLNFDAEADSDSETEATEWQRRKFAAALAAIDDGRQRSRVVTHPVVMTTVALSMPAKSAVSVHAAVRTRPASPSAYSSHLTASSQWSAQSVVARKAAAAAAAAASHRGGFQQQERDIGWRPNSMDFDAEVDSSDSDSEWLPGPTSPRYHYDQDDSRLRSRVTTHPVARTAMATGHNPTASVYHSPVRTRPVSPSPLNINLTVSQQPQPEQSATASSQLSFTQLSAVAKKAANSQKKFKKLKKQQKQSADQQQLGNSDAYYRPRSSSETSFGRLFFGWRRPAGYSKQAAAAAEAAAADAASRESPSPQQQQQQQAQYRGKNVHNFSYVDAKIYSPQSQYQQQQQKQQTKQQTKQKQQQQQGGTSDSRTRTWWTMETMGAVNSAYSNQIMLAREVPTASPAAFPI